MLATKRTGGACSEDLKRALTDKCWRRAGEPKLAPLPAVVQALFAGCFAFLGAPPPPLIGLGIYFLRSASMMLGASEHVTPVLSGSTFRIVTTPSSTTAE